MLDLVSASLRLALAQSLQVSTPPLLPDPSPFWLTPFAAMLY